MAQPFDYGVNIPDPAQAFKQAFEMGTVITQQRLAQEEAQKKQLLQTELANLYKNPNASATDYARVAAFLPKDQAEIVTKGFERKTKEQQQNDLLMGGQVYSAIKAGSLDIAERLLTQKATALRNSNRENEAVAAENALELIKLKPEIAQATIGLYMAKLPGGTEYLTNADKALSTIRAEALAPVALREALAKANKAEADAITAQATATNAPEQARAAAALVKAQAEKAQVDAQYAEQIALADLNQKAASLGLTAAQIRNIDSEIVTRAGNLSINAQTMQATVAETLSRIRDSSTKLPEGVQKLINDVVTQGAASKQSATQYNDLAKRIETAQGGKGRFTSTSEWFATQLGNQDAWTQIRNEYTRVRNSVAIKALPPGVATDKDIELALKGIPPESANSATLASFLRGSAKLQDIDSAINNSKADWLSQNKGSLTRSKDTFIAGDYAVKPGETFNDFAQRIVGDVAKKYRSPDQIAADERAYRASQIPTTLPLQPGQSVQTVPSPTPNAATGFQVRRPTPGPSMPPGFSVVR